METPLKTPENPEDNSDDENSDDGLQIVLESPRPKRKPKILLDESDKEIIACVEKDLEETLEEKAAKANLSAVNVKSILKEVVKNEHVLALLKKVENPDDQNDIIYEPKCTRARTKELLSTNSQPIISQWVQPPPPKSEVHVLISEELQEDDDDDEYVPEGEKTVNSVEDEDLEVESPVKDEEEAANIALRTRSKLSLSDKPLEEIECAFMPPDISADMYDMDCDDDVWKEFLKTFTKPLDEVQKLPEEEEEEEQDPEYNILADEAELEKSKADKEDKEILKEEFRADRAVNISKKELNALMAELFEYADLYEQHQNYIYNIKKQTSFIEKNNQHIQENSPQVIIEVKSNLVEIMNKNQMDILAQQLRQHVQLLTQHFLLTYEHPEYSNMAPKFKNMLEDLNSKSEEKPVTMFKILNLPNAIEITKEWEKLFDTNSPEVVQTKEHVNRVVVEWRNSRFSGTQYIPSFPPLVMDVIARNNVFMYVPLLPKVPFKPTNPGVKQRHYFTQSENSLIALFLEQNIPILKQDPYHVKYEKEKEKEKSIKIRHVCHYIQNNLMPHLNWLQIEKQIRAMKRPEAEDNPIKQYFENEGVPPFAHYVFPIDPFNIPAPCNHPPESLPTLWRNYLHPELAAAEKLFNNSNNTIILSPINQLSSPARNVVLGSNVFQYFEVKPFKNFTRRTKNKLGKQATTIKQRTKKSAKCLFTSGINKSIVDEMWPDMPSLGETPTKDNIIEQDNTVRDSPISNNESVTSRVPIGSSCVRELSFQSSTSLQSKPGTSSEMRTSFQDIELNNQIIFSNLNNEKENSDDLIDSSTTTVKITKKEPSGAEKKRTKIRKAYLANLQMATPESKEAEDESADRLAESYHKKLEDELTKEDFKKINEVFCDFEDRNHSNFQEFFTQIQNILFPKHEELAEEFLLFLTLKQASQVQHLGPHLQISDMSRLMKKTRLFFKDQPAQWKKFLKCLTDLGSNPNCDLDAIRDNLLPFFKGNEILTEWYMQHLPPEKPSKILTSGPYEVVDLRQEMVRLPDEEIYETIKVPDSEDPYGGPNCICECHQGSDNASEIKSSHCKRCGLKFIQGKAYINTGKSLRRAVVSFLTNPDKDHSKRLMSAAQVAKLENSPNKQSSSPQKENHPADEARNSNESEDECDGTKKKKPKNIKHRKQSKSDKTVKPSKEKRCDKQPKLEKSPKRIMKRTPKKRSTPKKQLETEHEVETESEIKPGATPGQQKRLAEDIVETELSEATEFAENKATSDCGESESEFFESSQEITNTDDDTGDDSVSSNTSPIQKSKRSIAWKREEDKIILLTLQQEGNKEETFQHIAQLLEHRNVTEIKNRFKELMSFLDKFSPNSL